MIKNIFKDLKVLSIAGGTYTFALNFNWSTKLHAFQAWHWNSGNIWVNYWGICNIKIIDESLKTKLIEIVVKEYNSSYVCRCKGWIDFRQSRRINSNT